jgi:N-acetylmuramoyl-L-alanine amidase
MAIFLTAGHNNSDPGAVANGYRESDLTRHLRTKTISHIDKTKYQVHVDHDNWNLARTIKELVTGPASACADIHFNAGNPSATGVEVFVPDDPSVLEIKYANLICLDFSKIMGIKNRGVKRPSESQHKTLAILSEQGINLLIEVCFISNQKDIAAFFKHDNDLAQSLAARLMQMDDEIK